MDSDQPEHPDDQGQGDSPSSEEGGRGVRHRRHRFPARTRVVKARYDEQEYAALASAAERAWLTPSGFLAGAGLAAAGMGAAPSQSVDRELLAELLSLRAAIRRYRRQRQPGRRPHAQHRRDTGLAVPRRCGRPPRCPERRCGDPARWPPDELTS